MSDLQRRIDDLTTEGDAATRRGHSELARQFYQAAALLNEDFLRSIPADARKTRGIVMSSVATLYAQAQDYERARRFIYQSLSAGDLSPSAEQRLESVLSLVLDRLSLAQQGREYEGDALGIALRGGEVGRGTAPADVVVNSMRSWQALVIRFAESVLGLPYRPRGTASPALLQAVSPRVSQPMTGSFRFDLQLSRAKQPSMLDRRIAEGLVDQVTGFIRATSVGDGEFVTKQVPNKQYREAILELTKAVIPTGRSVQEAGVTVRRPGRRSDTEDIVLRPELRLELAALIRNTRPELTAQTHSVEGVLRGLELNQQWIALDLDDGRSKRLLIDDESLEDVISSMVNRRVRIEAEEVSGGLRVISLELSD